MARESVASRRNRARAVAKALAAAYPLSTCALTHETPFQLLVATVLSAQTTDLAVNRATRELFRRYPDAPSLAQAREEDIGRLVSSIGLWRAKARNVHALSRILVAEHGGEVPRSLEELMDLPGVGRKTATAVLGQAFGMPAGITVDTHMLRINRLLRLSAARDPEAMAADLERLLPPEAWTSYTHRIIDHGRLVCVAGRPRCGVCPLAKLCPSAFKASVGYKPQNDEKQPASAAGLSWKTNGNPRNGGKPDQDRKAKTRMKPARPLPRPATPRDLPAVQTLLSEAGLPLDGLADCELLLVAERAGRVAAAIGFERHGHVGLLRSLVVAPDARGTGLGRALLDAGVAAMRAAGLREAYGLTTTIPDLLRRRGWTEVPRSSLPRQLLRSAELRGACPDSAPAFRLPL